MTANTARRGEPTATAAPTCLLAFDTSTEALAVALRAGGRDLLLDEAGGALASARLLPGVHRLLAAAGVALRDIDAIAFGTGPGAFTGLRTACAVAQGLGFGLGCPLLPLDSLLIVAEDARAACSGAWTADGTKMGGGSEADTDIQVDVVMDARMSEVYAGRYRHAGGRWSPLWPPALYTLAALAQRWSAEPPARVAGSALRAFDGRLGVPAGVPVHPDEHGRAGALLRLALAQRAAGVAVDAADALPLYLRDKVAQTVAERAAAVTVPAQRQSQPARADAGRRR